MWFFKYVRASSAATFHTCISLAGFTCRKFKCSSDTWLSAGHSKCSLKNVWTYLHNIRTFLVCHVECYPHSNSGGDYGWFQNNNSRDLWYHMISVIMDDHHPKRLFSSRIAGIAIKYMQNHHFGHLQKWSLSRKVNLIMLILTFGLAL